ncbi:hypothetical protein [Streptomyces sp. enrichment culture]|uniref:hypothetical protein n=1 Tax=Streptomyces sp. enrichment culture TaxID=1795815 RepID=UPI003F56E242
MSERTAVSYSDGVIIVSDPDPVDEIHIQYARRVVAAAKPNLEADNLTPRELRYIAVELARCVEELLVIIGDSRD